MNIKGMFDFTFEQKEMWDKTNDDIYKNAWLVAREMISIAGLWDEWKEYITNKRNNDVLKG